LVPESGGACACFVIARIYSFVGELANVRVDSGEADRFQRSRSQFGAVSPEAHIAEFWP
jgi:hypothetical protein